MAETSSSDRHTAVAVTYRITGSRTVAGSCLLRSIHTSAQRSTTAAMAALVTDDVAEAGIAKAMAKLQTEDEPGDWTEGMDASQLERAKASLRWAPGYYERVEAGARSTCVKPSALHGAGLFATRAFRRGDVVLRERPLVALSLIHI